ncbi:chemotaxis protein CheY [bacterium BMS3Abin07]|nr:chemotaxis protein CheY [bacterium BMS3Abin07]HDL21095.1 response regulator [Nitrospirota bacterium]HDO21957.1 response regulator [Nitrospirota bacterium]HDO22284.1 response regulator [Nitrospirota bacterium]HDZ87920.1 response regulator [Nitrospirota bacterium]
MGKILIVDDSTTTRSLIRAVIEDMSDDFDAYEAQTGFEALKLLPSESFDLIITDINMPDINGLELISFVKSNAAYRDIPLIIVSTESSEEDRKRGVALGAEAYITKPFQAADLQQEIKRVLGK